MRIYLLFYCYFIVIFHVSITSEYIIKCNGQYIKKYMVLSKEKKISIKDMWNKQNASYPAAAKGIRGKMVFSADG